MWKSNSNSFSGRVLERLGFTLVNAKYTRKRLLLSDRMAGLIEGLPVKLEAIL